MRCRPRKRDLGTRTSDTQMEASEPKTPRGPGEEGGSQSVSVP